MRPGVMLRKPNIVVQSRGTMSAMQHKLYVGMLYIAREQLTAGKPADSVPEKTDRFQVTLERLYELGRLAIKTSNG